MRFFDYLKDFKDKKGLKYLKNKFVFTGLIFLFYALFLDDNDLFSMMSHKSKLNKLEASKALVTKELKKTRFTLNQLKYTSELERYAREEKFFKKENEDIFVISYE